jgi:signal transduction histidine kinase
MKGIADFKADIDAIGRIDAVPLILDVVCRVTGMGFAAVARVTEDRWIACQVKDEIGFGLKPGGELKVETTLCNEIRASRLPIVIDQVAEDAEFRGHHTPARYGFQSYISLPIVRRDGSFFGTLCAIDPKPAKLKEAAAVGMFKLFAELIANHLDADEQLAAAQTALAKERSLSELREQFVAVLGHDLRNPLAAVHSGAALLRRVPLDEKSHAILAAMQGSILRMRGIIENVLNLARTRHGEGLTPRREASERVQEALEQIVGEYRLTHPGRTIETDFALHRPVAADPELVAQLFANLLSNALTHGDAEQPVRTGARAAGGSFVLWVANAGEPIPAATTGSLFLPFFRGSQNERQGLGLGLYIAAEIARAHGGTLDVSSTPAETRFTLRMPV